MEKFNKSIKNTILFLNSYLTKENISENEMNDALVSIKEFCLFWIENTELSSEIKTRIETLKSKVDKKVVIKIPFWVSLSSNVFGYMAQEKQQTGQFIEELKIIRNELSSIEFLVKWEN
ncbi:MAG: hypothetical protein ACK46Y_03575 [Fluviicola sp.]